MSGLYLLIVLGIWCGVTWMLLKGLPIDVPTGSPNRMLRIALATAVLLAWFGASFWYGGGRKVYYDAEVNRLCMIDGGVKVFETVPLAPERFNQYGNVDIPNKRFAKSADEYYFETEIQYLRTGNPSLEKVKTTIVRRRDEKALGTSIRYGRGGGDLVGPWHGSSFDCPSISSAEGKLEQSIFLKGGN